ncbi:MAG: replication-associated recombination protein A, partial [Sediminibacterium sp.]|nr:replication-associated recombination protein A [Sediminibacterium sp.]
MLAPLAERLRPQRIEDIIGQEKLLSKGAILYNLIQQKNIPSLIFWGPPGVGKTTIAFVIANMINGHFYAISAINSGVKDLRDIIEKAQQESNTIVFIDEIHRFNKGQQDALLSAVEKGIITLIGATTENPSFEVNKALLSRCQIFILENLTADNLKNVLNTAILKDAVLKKLDIRFKEYDALIQISGGDVRKLLNLLELVIMQHLNNNSIVITNELVQKMIQKNIVQYDKDGEQHYDIISAFIKSMRGSDPNATVYWLARMIDAGEDLKFIARRMLIFSSEDIGNANPNALLLANSCFEAVQKIGYPESRIILSQCAIYLACSAKSNASYMAIDKALNLVQKTGNLPVPLHLRNAPTKLMKDLNYGKAYLYPHNYEQNFTNQEYLPESIANTN